MNHTTTIIDLGNNEQLSQGIFKNSDGTYTAMTFTQSKEFKTLNGAKKWMQRKTAR
jgi:hypothetical protein